MQAPSRRPLRRSDLIMVGIIAAAFVLGANSPPLAALNGAAYDLGARLAPSRPASDQVVVVAIDDAALEERGNWPWPHSRIAEAIEVVASGKPRAIATVMDLGGPGGGRGLEYVRAIGEAYYLDVMSKRRVTRNRRLEQLLEEAESALGGGDSVVRQWARKSNVIIGTQYTPRATSRVSASAGPNEAWLDTWRQRLEGFAAPVFRYALGGRNGAPSAVKLNAPIAEVGDAEQSLGVYPAYQEGAGTVRSIPLLVREDERRVASLGLLIAAAALGTGTEKIKPQPGGGVRIGHHGVRTDAGYRFYPRFYPSRDGTGAVRVDSVGDVLGGRIGAKDYRDKVVLLGVTAPGVAEEIPTPLGINLSSAEILAYAVSSLLNNDGYAKPAWAGRVQLGALLVVAVYLLLVLPRLRMVTGVAVTLLLTVAALNAHVFLMTMKNLWLPPMVPVTMLVIGHVLFAARQYVEHRLGQVHAQAAEANLLLGKALQSQGQLDSAFERLRRCPADGTLLEQLYSLALDYERKRQYNKAATVLRYMAGFNARFRDIDDRIKRIEELENRTVLGTGRYTGSGTLIVDESYIQKPTLGRYELQEELGRGAMGAVYLGRDPRIGRTVAIKTINFVQEFDSAELEEVKARFYREAETAGRLAHPNIVTIYDVGEEDDVAYIAMDFIKGDNLVPYTRLDNLLPVPTVLQVAEKVASALDYAHDQGVVHRDIKPENILYNAETQDVKVTDFGVACIAGSNKTRTGALLGTPSYMSPEQLAGKKIDGRTDLFSLGVTLYQLLTGRLPFESDSLANLMYKISREQHPGIRSVRSDLPACTSRVINRALQKNVKNRYESGADMARALLQCAGSAKGKRSLRKTG